MPSENSVAFLNKHQIRSPKSQINSNVQNFEQDVSVIRDCDLEFVWNLKFGIWNLVFEPAEDRFKDYCLQFRGTPAKEALRSSSLSWFSKYRIALVTRTNSGLDPTLPSYLCFTLFNSAIAPI